LRFTEKLVNIIYPPKCIFCGQVLGYESLLHICGVCYDSLPFARETLTALSQESSGSCDGAVSVFQYAGKVKDALIRFKFYNKPGYYRTYARLIASRITKLIDVKQVDMIMGVPLHRQKEFARGYNQAYLISKALGRELGIRDGSRFLRRIRSTSAQSLLDRHERHQNVKDAFCVTAPERVKGKSIILIDDIMTTGSTLEECCRMLKEAGAAEVTAAVVATGRKI
jgi:ComF family protein